MTNPPEWQELLGKPAAVHHVAQLYRHQEQLINVVSHYVAEGLRHDEAVILIVTPEHWSALFERLEMIAEVDLKAAVLRGQLRILDAQITLAECMPDGEPDWHRFDEVVGNTIARTGKRFDATRIFGEMVNLLWLRGRHSGARRVEEFWNVIRGRQPFSLLCAYEVDRQDEVGYDVTRWSACETHSHLVEEVGNADRASEASLYVEAVQ